ncbi:MAG: 6-bladed beta-propeller [Saprospiraceae bacterium]|nr:6-bladed beta-propeller [Saprospiraceae bacterium]
MAFFDSKGNLLKRLYPYSQTLDNYSTRLSGFITSGDENQCWFSPPYCDTIYSINGHDITPKYIFNFADKSVPLNVKLKKNSGWDLDNYAYLTESFVKLKDCFLFTYYNNQRLHHVLYDEQNGRMFRFNDASDDYLKQLVKSGVAFYKNDDTFALYVNAARINYLLENKVLDMNSLEKNCPELYSCLININYSSNKNPLLIYFSLNKAFPN